MLYFFDIEKAHDLLWKEGLLIKLNKLGVNWKIYNWVLDLMFGRKIEVKVGTEYSKQYQVENERERRRKVSVVQSCLTS